MHADVSAHRRTIRDDVRVAGATGLRMWVLGPAAVFLAACNDSQVRVACEDVSPTVQIDYSDVLRLHPHEVTLLACVEDDCTLQIIPGGRNRPSVVTLGKGSLREGQAASAKVAITDRAGQEVFSGDVGIMPDTGQTTGSGCPAAWVGQLLATGRHTLKQLKAS